jgi:hypothetical protein
VAGFVVFTAVVVERFIAYDGNIYECVRRLEQEVKFYTHLKEAEKYGFGKCNP